MASLMPRVRVTSLGILLALGGRGRGARFTVRNGDAGVWSGDVQHPLDICGLRPGKWKQSLDDV